MDISADCFLPIDHSQTHSFSNMVLDYLQQQPALQSFYEFAPTLTGVKEAVEKRRFLIHNREVLVEVLKQQYAGLKSIPLVNDHIDALLKENTFTITTAHQPNLLGGPLYFIYKILHTVKLASYLGSQMTEKQFVPVFYIGSEDNDLEELGHFFFYGQDYTWDTDQTGAVGRMRTHDLQALLQSLFAKMGPPGPPLEKLQDIITRAFSRENTIATATQIFVHELLGTYGIVVLNPDDARLKALYVDIMEDDLLRNSAMDIVHKTSGQLPLQYKSQAFVRDINLFYLKGDLRERIEKQGVVWKVVNTDVQFTEEALLNELKNYPERFSPNVILRGMYQESILPNVAFIGGGSEVAYWMQLKELFVHYKVDFPALILRQSFLMMDRSTAATIAKTELPIETIFEQPEEVIKKKALAQNQTVLLVKEKQEVNSILSQIQEVASALDVTLKDSAAASISKINFQLDVISQKMLRAEKRKYEILENRLFNIRHHLYPKGVMQERKQSFMDYYLSWGDYLFDILLAGTNPFGEQFTIVKLPDNF